MTRSAGNWSGRLSEETATERAQLLEDPRVARLLTGDIQRAEYMYFLWQSHFHMKAAVRAFALAAARLDEQHARAARYYVFHASDEWGEEQWCLNDLAALGAVQDRSEFPEPSPACQAYLAYLLYLAQHDNPVALLADSYVLEGIVAPLGTTVAANLRQQLHVGGEALTYIERHVEIDSKHFAEFQNLLQDAIQSEADFRALSRAARCLLWLYREFLADVATAGAAAASNFLEDAARVPACVLNGVHL